MEESSPTLSEQSNDLTTTLITDDKSIKEMTVKKSFFERAFSPLLRGSLRGSIFTLLASAMGTGVFNLPFRINEIGILAYALFLVVGGLYSYLGMYFISSLIQKFKVQSYSSMSEKSFGRSLRRIAEFCLIIYPWGSTICFQVIFAKFVIQLLTDIFNLNLYDGDIGRETQTYSESGQWICIGVTVGAILLNLIFILKKQIGVLQKIAIVGVLSVIINVFIIVFTFLFGFIVQVQDKTSQVAVEYTYHGITSIQWNDLNWFNSNGINAVFEQMKGVASLIFCFVSHQLIFPLVFNLNNPTQRRIKKVFNRVHITEIICYFFVGMTGYLLLAEHAKERPINAMVMASIKTVPMSIGKCLMVVYMFFAVPLNLFPSREVFYQTFGITKSNKNHLIVSLSMAFSGAIIAILFQKINSYFGVLGGTAGVMMTGVIPTLCYAKLVGLKSWKQKLISVFMFLVSLFGIFGAFLSVIVQ